MLQAVWLGAQCKARRILGKQKPLVLLPEKACLAKLFSSPCVQRDKD